MDVLQQAVAAVTGKWRTRFDAIRRARSNTLGDAELTVHSGSTSTRPGRGQTRHTDLCSLAGA